MNDRLAKMCTSGIDLLDHMKNVKEGERGLKVCDYLIPTNNLLVLLLEHCKANATHFFQEIPAAEGVADHNRGCCQNALLECCCGPEIVANKQKFSEGKKGKIKAHGLWKQDKKLYLWLCLYKHILWVYRLGLTIICIILDLLSKKS